MLMMRVKGRVKGQGLLDNIIFLYLFDHITSLDVKGPGLEVDRVVWFSYPGSLLGAFL